jgi:hypothetical protein
VKIIHVRCAGAITGEEESQHTEEVGISSEVIGGIIILFRYGSAVTFGTGPILAEQRALVRVLFGIPIGKGHAMRGSKE